MPNETGQLEVDDCTVRVSTFPHPKRTGDHHLALWHQVSCCVDSHYKVRKDVHLSQLHKEILLHHHFGSYVLPPLASNADMTTCLIPR